MTHTSTQGGMPPLMHIEPKPPFPAQHQERPGIEAELDPNPRFQAARYKAACKLSGKIALVRSTDSGIGRAVAILYAQEGADVAISYLPQEQQDAEETHRAIEKEGRRCLQLPGDLSDPQLCTDIVE